MFNLLSRINCEVAVNKLQIYLIKIVFLQKKIITQIIAIILGRFVFFFEVFFSHHDFFFKSKLKANDVDFLSSHNFSVLRVLQH